MPDVDIASMRLILRLRPGTVLKPVDPPEDIWRRFWWWTEKIETESGRRIFDCRSYYCHLFKYNDVRESVQFDPQVHHEKISSDYLQTYGWLVQFDELEIDDSGPEPDEFLKLLRHLALHIGMPVSSAYGELLPEPGEETAEVNPGAKTPYLHRRSNGDDGEVLR